MTAATRAATRRAALQQPLVVRSMSVCWLCGGSPVVAATLLGNVCAECSGDGSPILMGPTPSLPRRGYALEPSERERDGRRGANREQSARGDRLAELVNRSPVPNEGEHQ